MSAAVAARVGQGTVLRSSLDTRSELFVGNRRAQLTVLAQLESSWILPEPAAANATSTAS